jgi:hypothetical protein
MKHDPTSSHTGHRRRHRQHDRKERVLHTRISEQLAEDIRQFAEDLRVPASNLVRNVLEEVFTIVDSVSGDVGDLFDDVLAEAEAVRDRVRGKAASGRRGGGGRTATAWARERRRTREQEADLEAEFMQDEASESTSEPIGPKPAGSSESSLGADREDGGVSETGTRRAEELFPEILGWQPLVLNREFACGCCDRPLAAGESAFLGVGEQGLTATALCGRCAGRR